LGVIRGDRVAVIGAGPAGISAVIQLSRSGIRPTVFEEGEVGGLLRNANLVENYSGFPGGISGMELCGLFRRQFEAFSPELIRERVVRVDYDGGVFAINTPSAEYFADVVVVASGTISKKPDVAIPQGLTDRVFTEIVPIMGASGKTIVIVGAGDAAFDYALNLSRKNRVIILNRGERLSCLGVLFDRAMGNSRIEYRTNASLTAINPAKSGKIALEISANGDILTEFADYLVFAIGRVPRTDFLAKKISQNTEQLMREGVLHFIGDVHGGRFRQTGIAVGEGILTAMKIAERRTGDE